jgi:hypothetical protein
MSPPRTRFSPYSLDTARSKGPVPSSREFSWTPAGPERKCHCRIPSLCGCLLVSSTSLVSGGIGGSSLQATQGFCTMSQTCEACERAAADTVESCDDPQAPYRLCWPCHRRLHARSLRPLEWYNLAKRHGSWKHLLHDDFYEQDGTAIQAEGDVELPGEFPAPTLAAVAHDAQSLLDYSITRWRLELAEVAAWAALPGPDVLTVLSQRFAATYRLDIRARVLEISAMALREAAGQFVRNAWSEYPARVSLPALARASAACLPFREGFDRVVAALAEQSGAHQRILMSSLGYFHSPEALDWIEQHIFDPINDAWGYLAAESGLDWPRVERWLERGRPLSLVALDALAVIVRPRSLPLRTDNPRLQEPPSLDRFKRVLSAYAEKDRVPRVQRCTARLFSQAESLTKSG